MESKKKTLIIVSIIIAGILIIGVFYIVKNLNKFPSPVSSLISEPESPSEQKQISDSGRYFLSEVELIENTYTPALIKCLFDEEGNQIYQQWSVIYYPSYPAYEVALVRVELNEGISLSDTCFIKEMLTEKDWLEIETKYNFSKEKFRK